MKRFVEFLYEGQFTTPTSNIPADLVEIAEDMAKVFKKHFRHGHTHPHRIGFPDVYFLSIGLIGDIQDVSNRIRKNDPLDTTFEIGKRGEGNYVIQLISGGTIPIVDEAKRFVAFTPKKIPYRRISGNSKKVIQDFERYITRLKAAVKKHEKEFYGRDRIADKYFQL